MIIYSNKTHRQYDTVDECLAAEAEFDRKEAEKKNKLSKKKDRKKEIDELIASFIEDYGSYSYRDENNFLSIGSGHNLFKFNF